MLVQVLQADIEIANREKSDWFAKQGITEVKEIFSVNLPIQLPMKAIGSFQVIERCPISQAVRRMTGAWLVRSGPREIDIIKQPSDTRQAFKTPHAAAGFMARWDKGEPVEPFTFVADPMPPFWSGE